MKTLLPVIKDRAVYKEIFAQNNIWEPAIVYLMEKHRLNGDFQRGVLGSHIVYRVGDRWIKLMAPIFSKDMPFEISGLKVVDGKLSVPTPKIIAEGVCQADPVIKDRFHWNSFIKEQYETWEIHQKRKGLSDQWLQEIPKFLSQFPVSEFECVDPLFLHADLTFDHFLVTGSSSPRISGVIDMADCQVGHFEYELVAPCTFIFKGQKELLRRFLMVCGYSAAKLDRKFSEKLLAWAILHRYFSMISYFRDEMDCCRPGDFQELAQKVYPL